MFVPKIVPVSVFEYVMVLARCTLAYNDILRTRQSVCALAPTDCVIRLRPISFAPFHTRI